MEINTEEKKAFVIEYLQTMKNNPHLKIFYRYDYLKFGFFDSQFVTTNTILSIEKAEQALKNIRKISLDSFIKKLRGIFVGISDYLLEEDKLQYNCELGIAEVNNLQADFKNKFYSQKKLKTFSISFQKQIQLVYYLKKYQQNQEKLKQIGQAYQIMTQTQDELIFHLRACQGWESLLKDNSL